MVKAEVSIAAESVPLWNDPGSLAARPTRCRVAEQSGHHADVTGLGVIRQRALDGSHGSFSAPAVVRAEDRVGEGVGVSRPIASATHRSSGKEGQSPGGCRSINPAGPVPTVLHRGPVDGGFGGLPRPAAVSK